jgi:hypothetical protein
MFTSVVRDTPHGICGHYECINIVYESQFTSMFQVSQTRHRASDKADGFFHLGRTSDQRPWHRKIDTGWPHRDDANNCDVRSAAGVRDPYGPICCANCDKWWHGIPRVVPFRCIREPHL